MSLKCIPKHQITKLHLRSTAPVLPKFCTPDFGSGAPNGPLYRLTVEKGNFCTYFAIGAPNDPLYRLTGEK